MSEEVSEKDFWKQDVLEELKAVLEKGEEIRLVMVQSVEEMAERMRELREENAEMKAELEKVEVWKGQMNELLKDA